jgi:hypothetical protein
MHTITAKVVSKLPPGPVPKGRFPANKTLAGASKRSLNLSQFCSRGRQTSCLVSAGFS